MNNQIYSLYDAGHSEISNLPDSVINSIDCSINNSVLSSLSDYLDDVLTIQNTIDDYDGIIPFNYEQRILNLKLRKEESKSELIITWNSCNTNLSYDEWINPILMFITDLNTERKIPKPLAKKRTINKQPKRPKIGSMVNTRYGEALVVQRCNISMLGFSDYVVAFPDDNDDLRILRSTDVIH
jgi:hypothetical protein